jgi:glutamine amidotransferase
MTSHLYAYYRGLREYYASYLIETDDAKAVASSILLRHLDLRGRELESWTYLKF